MCAKDVTDTLDQALSASGLDHVNVVHRPRLLSDNGSSYIAGHLAEWLQDKGMEQVRGAPHHPQTQGKIERWHQTLKNRILLHNYYLPSELERQIEAFVTYYNFNAIMRASTISLLLMSTSAELRQSWLSARRSNAQQLQTVACSTT